MARQLIPSTMETIGRNHIARKCTRCGLCCKEFGTKYAPTMEPAQWKAIIEHYDAKGVKTVTFDVIANGMMATREIPVHSLQPALADQSRLDDYCHDITEESVIWLRCAFLAFDAANGVYQCDIYPARPLLCSGFICAHMKSIDPGFNVNMPLPEPTAFGNIAAIRCGYEACERADCHACYKLDTRAEWLIAWHKMHGVDGAGEVIPKFIDALQKKKKLVASTFLDVSTVRATIDKCDRYINALNDIDGRSRP